MYKLEVYTINVTAERFDFLGEIEQFDSFTFFDRLNGNSSAVITIDPRHPQVTASKFVRRRNAIALKQNNTIIWLGVIDDVSVSFNDKDAFMRVRLSSYETTLAARYTDPLKQFGTPTEVGTIAWTLINDSQNRSNGYLGFVQGTIENIDTKTRTYQFTNVLKAINNLTAVENSLNYKLTYIQDSDYMLNSVAFNALKSLGEIRTDIPTLVLGENITSFSLKTYNPIVNYVVALGVGIGDAILAHSAESAASQQSYSRQERVLPQKEILELSTLVETADRYLKSSLTEGYRMQVDLNKNEQIKPNLEDLNIGDTLNIQMEKSKGMLLDGLYSARLVEVSTTISKDGLAETELTLEVKI